MSWSNGVLLGFDLETTGVDPQTDVPVSYAFVRYGPSGTLRALGGLDQPGM